MTRNRLRVAVPIGLILTLGALSWFLFSVFRAPLDGGTDGPIHPARDEASESSPLPLDLSNEPRSAGPAQVGPGLEEQLAAFHGAAWDERRQFLIDLGYDLGARDPLPPWEEVQAEIVAKISLSPKTRASVIESTLEWADELTAEWVSEKYSRGFIPSAQDLAELSAAVEETHQQMRETLARYLDDVDAAIATQVALDRVVRAPLTTRGMPRPPPEGNFFSGAAGHRGWSCSVSLHSSDFPHIKEAQHELNRMRRARDRIVKEKLAELRRFH